ncbi:hypothetical protein [Herbaspirillum sp.]|nr:hypothetical protein [Herbaspirillum sp.]|tara:strand:- start:631 stop:768 length:138 start_codon:yes stop_codon:yes gene_type:complete
MQTYYYDRLGFYFCHGAYFVTDDFGIAVETSRRAQLPFLLSEQSH